ncbi:MAG: DedA family protein [Coriobacteriales bacterium]|nr:DedA family protein [Coriobacteriales bacterium]
MDPAPLTPLAEWVLGALGAFGYLIVFGATVFENLFVVGSLTPGETVVIAGGFAASLGRLTWWGVWLSSIAGTAVGSNISYWGGRKLGRDALVRLSTRSQGSWIGRLFKITPQSIEDSEQYFIDHGAKTVLVARFAVGLKNFVPVIAGVGKMSVFWFEVYTLLGAVIYTTAMVAIGWVVGSNFNLALRIASSIGWAGLLIVAIFVAFILWTRRRVRYRRQAKAAEKLEAEPSTEEDEA